MTGKDPLQAALGTDVAGTYHPPESTHSAGISRHGESPILQVDPWPQRGQVLLTVQRPQHSRNQRLFPGAGERTHVA